MTFLWTTRWRVLLAVLTAVLSSGVVVDASVRQATPVSDESDLGATPVAEQPVVHPPDAPVHGAAYGEWGARHWQWTASFPIGANPGHDPSGNRCGYGQAGPVFFAPRNFAPCVVPAGMSVLVPIAGTICSTAESPPYHGDTEEELRDCAADDTDRYTGIVVHVDDQVVPDIEAYRFTSPRFTLVLPENNVLGAPAGPAQAVTDGYQIILTPLSPGEHEVTVHVELTDGTVLPDETLRITVVESSEAG